MGEVVQFIPERDLDRARLIQEARAIYEGIFPTAEVGSIVCHGPVDDPKGGCGLSIFSAKDQTEVERLTAADSTILDDVGARYEILPMKQLRMKGSDLSKPSSAEVSLHVRHR
jgi:hypothetical protein